MSTIPMVDLRAQHAEVAQTVAEGFAEVLDLTAFVGGKAVTRFEEAYASFIGVRHCVGVANGTDAIEISLRASGVRPGDEVIVPANTFVATVEAILRAGAVPKLVDCDEATFLVDTEQVLASIDPRTSAVVPVALYGQAAPVDRLDALPPHVAVVEDAAQSQGARRAGRSAGALGTVAGTSFYPGKNLGAYGDAGAVLTDDDEVAGRARLIANHGSQVRYRHETFGFNSRLDTLQAVVLSAKLDRLEVWNDARRRVAGQYQEALDGVDGVVLPTTLDGNEHVWHLFVVRVPERDRVLSALHAAGIGAGIHYPTPIHRHPAYTDQPWAAGRFPVAERTADEILSLPIHPHLTPDQVDRVVSALLRALRGKA